MRWLTIEVADAKILGPTEAIAPPVLGLVAAFVVGLFVRQGTGARKSSSTRARCSVFRDPGGLIAVRDGSCSFVGKSSQTIVHIAYGPCKVFASL